MKIFKDQKLFLSLTLQEFTDFCRASGGVCQSCGAILSDVEPTLEGGICPDCALPKVLGIASLVEQNLFIVDDSVVKLSILSKPGILRRIEAQKRRT